MTKDFADIDWTAAKAENARLRERERALIDELAEANAAHDDAETRVDAALLDLRIANEALATFNARVLGLEAELAEARRDAAASLSQRADLVEELAEAKVDKDEANDHIIACQEFLVKNGTQPGGDGSVVVGMVTLVERCDEQRERAETLEAKLAGALDARDEAVAALANARASAPTLAGASMEKWAECIRAAAIEECREKAKQMGEWGFADVLTRLTPPPPSGRFVADEVLEQARTAIEHLAFGLDPDDFPTAQARYAAQLKISEDALKALFPDWTAPRLDIALAALNAEKQR